MRTRNLSRSLAVVAVIGAIGFASFGARAWSPARLATQDAPSETTIDFPAEGAEVAGPNVLVQWTAPDQTADGDELHVDLIADDGAVRIDRATNPAVVPRLAPGEHTLVLEVQDEDDTPVADGGGASVTFTVLYPMPVRLLAGTCDDLDFDPVAVLNDVVSGYSGSGRADLPDDDQDGDPSAPLPLGADDFILIELSETLLELPLGVLLGEVHSLVIYAPGAHLDDEEEEDEIVACGSLGGALYRARLMVGLTPQNDYTAFGIATLTDEGNQTRIRIEVYRDDADPVATPEPTATATPTETATPEPTATTDPTEIPINTPIPTSTNVPINTPVPTNPPPSTNTPVPTNTPVSTNTPAPTNTPVPTNTAVPTNPPAPTNTPASTNTPVPTNPPAPTSTPIPTNTPLPEPTEEPAP